VVLVLASVKTTLLTLLAFARTPMFRAVPSETVPLDVNVAMSAPVSALMIVKLVTVCAETHIGTHINAPQEIALQVVDMFIFYLLKSVLKGCHDKLMSTFGSGRLSRPAMRRLRIDHECSKGEPVAELLVLSLKGRYPHWRQERTLNYGG
jgi:hypothetical protein